uniref:NADH dehydrogenase subunit 4 n=1 Tax=Venerupis aspera TaxID=2784313 RepID=UPI001BEF14C7|nr:NADH dehydrogenase subunit 4 [Venerupis aspera]YP_010455419.1 NADH dehydrogenase subunit 4 [Ruditapes variegatus]QUA05874.1 NADH dehydrogenase subunit 4 [Venerupis aspera]UUA63024.1 NADH dehydrogenase subunit 4 [Ruditapes variegatus]
MSGIIMVGIGCVMLGFSFKNVSWFVLVCGLGVIVSVLSVSSDFYALSSCWFGVDEVGVLMIVLSLLVTMISLVSSYKDVKSDCGPAAGGFSIIEMVGFICLGSLLFFSVCGWMDFFFFFEFSLVPTFFLILKWGYQPERLQAGVYMLLYTVSSSLPLLMGLLWFWSYLKSDNMLLVKMLSGFYGSEMDFTWLVMCLGFIVKLPVYGFHGWLPKAHVEAPLSGSMMLAGVLLKFGGYGLVRFMWFSESPIGKATLLVLVMSLWGGVLSSCICVCQSDLKSFIAYSSIGHMGVALGSLLTFYSVGKLSCVCMLFAHGLCSPILFSLAASSYDISQSRNILLSKGVLRAFPMFSGMWFVFCVINMGFPPSLNFFSELFCVGSLVWMSSVVGVLGGLMCFVAGCYCLVLYSLVNHGGPSVMMKPSMNLSSRYIYSGVFSGFILVFGSFCLDLFFV